MVQDTVNVGSENSGWLVYRRLESGKTSATWRNITV